MNSAKALKYLAESFGILPHYHDLAGQVQVANPDTLKALLRANGLVLDSDKMIVPALADFRAEKDRRFCPREVIATAGEPLALDFGAGVQWHLTCEGERDAGISGRGAENITLPALAAGVHCLRVEQRGQVQSVNLIVAPPKLPMLGDVTGKSRIWGINLALYGLDSERNYGLGDFHDLTAVLDGLAETSADFLGINPVHSLGWETGGTISPYSPSHRGYLNINHIALDQVTQQFQTSAAVGILSTAGCNNAAAPKSNLIDYDDHENRHHVALEKLYALFVADATIADVRAFEGFCRESGDPLAEFVLFEALSEEHGADWATWPDEFRFKKPRAIAQSKQRLAPRIRFHSWLQWIAQQQLGTARRAAQNSGMSLGLYMDLAVGSRRGGAESWCDNSAIAQGVSLGAPPDHLNPAGQNWTLAAYAPQMLRALGYAPWRQAIAAAMRFAGVLRIDHVLGLNRSFWVPDDGSAGAYIRQPFETFLALISIEAARANTVVIGEDLGLVPDGFRDTMRRRGFYGYSVLQYEKSNAGTFKGYADLRPQSLACFGTHDTPTMKGFMKARDIDLWQDLGWIDTDTARKKRQNRGAEVSELMQKGSNAAAVRPLEAKQFDELGDAIHDNLATSPAAMVSVQIDDIFGVSEAQNLPGTIDEHPNWRRRCPVAPKNFATSPELLKCNSLMLQGGRSKDHKSAHRSRR